MNAKKEVMIAMDPEMAAKFQASTHVSRKYPLIDLLSPGLLLDSIQGYLCQYAQDLEQAKKNPQAN